MNQPSENNSTPETKNQLNKPVRKIAMMVAIILAIVGTLLSFPSDLAWVMSCWLAVYLTGSFKNGLSIVPLVITFLLFCLKGSFYNNTSIFMAVALALGVLAHLATFLSKSPDYLRRANGSCLLFCVLMYSIHSMFAESTDYYIEPDSSQPIVCLGDSLTVCGYPEELQKLVPNKVINKGVNGIETSDGIKLLPEILKLNPSIVVIELGGHDYNNGKSRIETFNRLEVIIERLKREEIEVVLMEIPRGLIYDPFRSIERELAEKHNLDLIGDDTIRTFVYFGPVGFPGFLLPKEWQRSSDGLHPNQNGNRVLAGEVADVIKALTGG